MTTKNLALLFATVALVSACGGGGDDDVAATPPAAPAPPAVASVPEAVSASVATFIGYLSSLVGLSDDSSEPLDLAAVNPPVTDIAEPTPLP